MNKQAEYDKRLGVEKIQIVRGQRNAAIKQLETMADTLVRVEGLLRNGLYGKRIDQALAEIDDIQDLINDWMTT